MSIIHLRFGTLTFRPTSVVLEDDRKPAIKVWAGNHYVEIMPAMHLNQFSRKVTDMAVNCRDVDGFEGVDSKKLAVKEFIEGELESQQRLYQYPSDDDERQLSQTLSSLSVALQAGINVFQLKQPNAFMITPSNDTYFAPSEQ